MFFIGLAVGLVLGFIAGCAFFYQMAKVASRVESAIEAGSKEAFPTD